MTQCAIQAKFLLNRVFHIDSPRRKLYDNGCTLAMGDVINHLPEATAAVHRENGAMS
jgi:hypothetical protein